MSIIYLTSVTGAPGVSTLATALTLNWPRPALLLEADTSKTTQLIPGYLRAEYKHDHGLTEAAVANMRGQLGAETLFQQTLPMGEERYGIPGFSDVGGAFGSTPGFWATITGSLDKLSAIAGVDDLDIFVDAGRYRPGDARATLLSSADSVLVLTGNTLPDANALDQALPSLVQLLEGVGHLGYLNLVISQGPHRGAFGPAVFGAREIKSLVDVETLETMPWDPPAAAHYSHGASKPTKKSPYMAKLQNLITALDTALAGRQYKPQETN